MCFPQCQERSELRCWQLQFDEAMMRSYGLPADNYIRRLVGHCKPGVPAEKSLRTGQQLEAADVNA